MQRPQRKWPRNVAIIFGAVLILASLSFWWLIREPRHIPWVKGLSESKVQSYFKTPNWEGTFWLTDRQEMEYRDHLRYKFPDVDFSSDSVLIKEYDWNGRYWDYCIWFKQQSGEWVVVDDLFWTAAIRF